MRALWTSTALVAVASVAPAACETCSIASVPTVRYCGIGEFCCGNGCCPKTMISFFKLAVGVVLLVMIMVWFCSYLRRGRRRETAWLRPPTVTPPPPYTLHGSGDACAAIHTAAGHPLPGHPARTAHAVTRAAAVHTAAAITPVPTHGPAPTLPDDLPPPYHTVVNIPPPYLPSYDGIGKTPSGPT